MDSSKLSAYEPSPLVGFPYSLYRYLSSDFIRSRQRALYNKVKEEIAEGGQITNSTLESLAYYHKVLEYVLLNADLSHEVQSRLAKESPQAALNSIISNYKSPSARVLELTIMTRAEYVCKLLLWSSESKCTLRYPLPMYYPILYGDFYWAHYFYARRPVDMFFERMVRYHLDYQNLSPSSILCLACLNHLKDFTSNQIEMLSSEPAIAFQAAILFRDRLPLPSLLMEASLSPQWAFHILTAIRNLPAELKEVCQMALRYSPVWMLEYLHATKMLETNRDKAVDLLRHSLEQDHPMSQDMKEGLTILTPAPVSQA